MKNYVFFDAEYANNKNKSICQIGLMALDAVTWGEIYPALDVLVDPADAFDFNCMGVHHITAERVAGQKTFDTLWPEMEKYFVNAVVVGHNVAAADLDALAKNLLRYNLLIPEIYYVDILEIARDCIMPSVAGDYSLANLCRLFGVDTGDAHHAIADASAVAALLRQLLDRFDVRVDAYVHHYVFGKQFSFFRYYNAVTMTRELNLLLGKVRGIMADNIINDAEALSLVDWLAEHDDFDGDPNGRKVTACLRKILEDGVVTMDEAKELSDVIIGITQGLSAAAETRATQLLQGFIDGIEADSVVTDKEILALQTWLYENDYLTGHFPFDKIKAELDEVLEDQCITETEKNALTKLFAEIFDPLQQAVKEAVTIDGKEFVLSGDFMHGTKEDVEKYIVSNGGSVNAGVRKKTDYVVVGAYGSELYANGSYGTKVKKAMEYGITVLSEKQLYGEV